MASSSTHQTTNIPSQNFPGLSCRWITTQDGASLAALLSSPDNHTPPDKVLDAEWGNGAVKRMAEHAVQNPTVTGISGKVISGPEKANLIVVEDGEPVGVAGFGCIKTLEREGGMLRAGDAGIVMRGDKRGKGYATDAMILTLDFGAAPVSEGGLQLDVLTITTLEDNLPMIKVIERLGFSRQKAVLRPAECEKGKHELYIEIPAEEWREKRSQK